MNHRISVDLNIFKERGVVNALFYCCQGNSYTEITEALDPLLRLARSTGTHVLCVHHTNKGDRQGGDAVLGSTAIFSSVDTLLMMKRYENYRTMQTTQRYGTDLVETTLHFDEDRRMFSIGKNKEDEDISMIREAIIEFLSQQEEPLLEPDIMEGVEGRTVLKRKALRELVKEGEIARGGRGSKGNPFKYACSLVPIYMQEQENKNSKNTETPCTARDYSCSQDSVEDSTNSESEEQKMCNSDFSATYKQIREVFTRCSRN